MADPIVDIAPDQIYRRSQEFEQDNSQPEDGKQQGEKLDKSYLRFNAIGTALGFLVNGYMYQVGAILLTLYVDVYHTVNDSSFLQSALSTSVLYGVLFGLIIFGFIADVVGRKAGLIMCSSLVILGSVISVAANGTSTDGMFWMIIVGRAIVGLGMGGEYTCNVPNVMEDSEDVSRKNRGRRVSLLVMFMEVVGNNTPSVLQLILVAAACRNVFIDTASKTGVVLPNCHPQVVWRLSYGLGLIPCIIVLAIRVRMRDSAMFEADAKLRKKSYDLLDLYVILRHFSSRMMGTVFMWFFIDWINYSQGNFGGVILSSIIGASLFKTAWIGLAEGVVLQSGPLVSSLVVDRLGRRRTEMLGWFWLASTQLITAGVYLQLAKHAVGYVIWTTFVFIFQYFVFIPVYLVPAEVYPTRIRATMYGWSSALGKVGGIVGTTVFPYMWRGFSPDHSEIGHGGLIGLRRVQWFYAGLEYLGFILAVLFVPEYSNVGLRGEDKRYLELRTRYAARLAKKYGVVPAHGDDQEATRLGRYSVWTLISRKLSGSRESYEEAKMEYIRMLLSRCSLETSEQVDYYANVPIYYDDRTLISHWYRRWSMGKEAAEEYIRQAHLLGESTTTEEEKNISHDKGDSVSQQLKDEVVTSKEEAVRGTYQEASHTLLEDNKR